MINGDGLTFCLFSCSQGFTVFYRLLRQINLEQNVHKSSDVNIEITHMHTL